MDFEHEGAPVQFLDHLPIVDRPAPRIVAYAALAISLVSVTGLSLIAALVEVDVKERADFTVVPADPSSVVRAPRQARLAEVLVSEGARVAAGQPLLRLEVGELARSLELALGDQQVARASVEALVRELRHVLLLGHEGWKRRLGASPEGALRRLAELEQELAELAPSSGAALGAAGAARLPAAAPALLESAESAALEARAGVARVKLAEARRLLARGELELASLRQQLAQAVIAAPHAGTVARLWEQGPGASLERGAELLWVLPEGPALLARALLPESACATVRVAMPVRFLFEERAAQQRGAVMGKVLRASRWRGEERAQCLVLASLPAPAGAAGAGAAAEASPVFGSSGKLELVVGRESLFRAFWGGGGGE